VNGRFGAEYRATDAGFLRDEWLCTALVGYAKVTLQRVSDRYDSVRQMLHYVM
jgi:hypothetical protein